MASLFNTKISDTYPGLIKTLDNAAISASLKELTDGSGNQSGLFINTAGDFKASGILEFGSLKDTGENITITKFVDEADGIANNDNDTTIPTSAAVVDYVASKITLEDLDFSGDSGTGSVDLDSQVFAITGTTNQIITSASSQTLNLSLPSTIHRNIQGNVTGNITGVGTLSDGSTAITQTDGDNSTKIATTAYVDTAIQGHDTLAEVLAGGNTTGGTDISVTTGDNINFADSTKANFGNSNDLEIYHNSTDNFYSGTTGDMYFINKADDKDIIFQSDNGTGGYDTYFKLWGAISSLAVYKDMLFVNDGNGGKLKFGASQDLQIYHEGSNSFIDDSGTGDLYVRASDNMYFQTYGSGKKWITLTENAGAELFYNDSKKLETTNTGITVTGNIDGVENLFLQDYIYHSGDGDTYFGFPTANEFKLVTGGSNIIAADANSAYLYYQGNVKLQTTSGGVSVTGQASVTNGIEITGGNANFADNSKARFGASADLEIYHDGTNSYIKETGTGVLYIQGSANVQIEGINGENKAVFNENGSVQLFYDNLQKFQTTSTGVNVTGNMVASGDVYAEDNIYLTDTGTARAAISLDSSDRDNLNIKAISLGSLMRFYTQDTLALALDASQNASFSQSVTIAGDLTVNGTTTTINTEHFNVEDPLISMAKDNAANSVDIGFYGRYNDGTNRYLGLFSDASDSNTFKLFKGTTTEPTTTVDVTATGYTLADLNVSQLNASSTSRFYGNGAAAIKFGNTSDLVTLSYSGTTGIMRAESGGALEFHTNGVNTALTLDTSQNAYFSGNLDLIDNKKILLGTSDDLQIFHNGTDSFIDNYTGNLTIRNRTDDGDIVFTCDDGSGGLAEYFRLDGGSTLNVFSKATWYGDGVKAMFGNSTDLQIYHNGSQDRIESSSSFMILESSNFIVRNNGGTEDYAKFLGNGAVELYYDNSKKFETTSTGVTITAEAVVGNGTNGLQFSHSTGNSSGIINTGFSSTAVEIRTGNVQRMLINSTSATFAGDVALTGSGAKIISAISSNNDSSLFLSASGSGKDTHIVFGNDRNLYLSKSSSTTATSEGTPVLTLGADSNSTFAGDVEAQGIYVGATNTSFDFYNQGTSYFNGTVTVDAAFTQSGGDASNFSGKVIVGKDSSNALEVFSSGDTEIGFSYATQGNIYAKIIGDITTASPLGGEIAFQTATGGTLTERMRIKSDGNIDIGTASATSSSKVTIQAQGSNGSDETALVLRNYSAAPYTGYVTQEFEVGTVNMAEISGRRVDINNGEIIFRNKKSGTISASMVIDSSGNVGIGGTPSTFANYTNVTIKGGSSGSNLDFKNSSGTRVAAIVSNPSSDFGIETNDATPILFKTNDTERMRITSSGQLGVNTTTFAPTITDQIKLGNMGSGAVGEVFDANVVDGAARMILAAGGNTGQVPIISLRHYSAAYGIDLWMGYSNPWNTYIDNRHTDSGFIFRNNCNADGSEDELMRIAGDGQVMIRRTVDYDTSNIYSLQVGDGSADNNTPIVCTVATTATRNQIVFSNNASNNVGQITTGGSSTSYNTSSDYRLKEDLQDFAGLDMVSKIPVYDFKWKTDESRSYGVMAHELEEVLPQAVVGEKDKTEEYEITPATYDDKGNIIEKAVLGTRDVPQGVDYSKIVPLLVKSIQELKAEIDELKRK